VTYRAGGRQFVALTTLERLVVFALPEGSSGR